MTFLGPNLSQSLPLTAPMIDVKIMDIEKAPDISVLVKPSSLAIGFKKMPKLFPVPRPTVHITRAATTIM